MLIVDTNIYKCRFSCTHSQQMYIEELNKRRAQYCLDLEAGSKELKKISVEWMDIRTAQKTYSVAREILGMVTGTIKTSEFIGWLERDLKKVTSIRALGENLALQELKLLPESISAQTLLAAVEKEYQYYLNLVFSDTRGTGEYFLRYRERLEASIAHLEWKLERVDARLMK